MRVDNVEKKEVTGGVEISATIDGFRLWFRLPITIAQELRADGLVAALLVPAMVVGEPLIFSEQLPVSPKLLAGVSTIQSIMHAWNPAFKKIAIEAGSPSAAPEGTGVGAFFSGGVDGTFTFLRHMEELQSVILINGFDFMAEASQFSLAVDRNRQFAERCGKSLLAVNTNYYDFGCKYRVSRAATYGGLLASIALNMGLLRTYIASGYGYVDMPPQGVHPMTDHLWNTEGNEFIHDGAESSRATKISFVAGNDDALRNLRVCWRDMNNNCGNCSKCLRTMTTLKLLGHDESRYFHRHLSIDDVSRLAIPDESTRGFTADNLTLAEQSPHQSMAKALRRRIWTYDVKQLLLSYDRVLLGGALQRIKSKIRSRFVRDEPPDIWPSARGH